MKRTVSSALFVIFCLVALTSSSFWVPAGARDTTVPLVFKGARLIDGTGRPAIENSVLIIRGDKIEAAGEATSIRIPKGAEIHDMQGKSIMPALINLHSHLGLTVGSELSGRSYTEDNIGRQLQRYLAYGVGTVLSLGQDQDLIYEMQDAQRAGHFPGARLYTAGRGFGGPGGYPPAVPNSYDRFRPQTPEEAQKDVRELAQHHPAFVKIWVDDNFGAVAKMKPAVYRAIIEEAHRQHLRVIAHEFYLADAKELVEAGVDGLAHSVRDQEVDNELIAAMKARGVFLIPTLVREEWTFVFGESKNWLDDPFFRAGLDPVALSALRSPQLIAKIRSEPNSEKFKKVLVISEKNLKILYDAGVKIGFGSDSGAPGKFLGRFEADGRGSDDDSAAPLRFLGYMEHRELQLMVEAGLTPLQAIAVATGKSAEILDVSENLGTLVPGKDADFLVLDGNPLQDISNTEKLSAVWQAGKSIKPIVLP
jgi:imidazolonepropionase-like amidohydrolase